MKMMLVGGPLDGQRLCVEGEVGDVYHIPILDSDDNALYVIEDDKLVFQKIEEEGYRA